MCSTDPHIYCVLTRFGLRGPRHLLATYRDYRAVTEAAAERGVPGLLHSSFLVESPIACFSLSLWNAEPYFSAEVPAHVHAANRVFGRLARDSTGDAELWSTQWALRSVPSNLNWNGFDLAGTLGHVSTKAT